MEHGPEQENCAFYEGAFWLMQTVRDRRGGASHASVMAHRRRVGQCSISYLCKRGKGLPCEWPLCPLMGETMSCLRGQHGWEADPILPLVELGRIRIWCTVG